MLSDIFDEDIKRDILGYLDLDSKSLADTLTLIEDKEMAARAMQSGPPVRVAPPAHVASSHNKHSSFPPFLLISVRSCQ